MRDQRDIILTFSIAAILYALLLSISAQAGDLSYLIRAEARQAGLNPDLAVAVARVESGLNPWKVGRLGEVGLFQIRPEFAKQNVFTIEGNVREGVRQLTYWRARCPIQQSFYWVACYNQGKRHPRHPELLPYVRKVARWL